jgi:hypothetical protein
MKGKVTLQNTGRKPSTTFGPIWHVVLEKKTISGV